MLSDIYCIVSFQLYKLCGLVLSSQQMLLTITITLSSTVIIGCEINVLIYFISFLLSL